MGGAVGVNTFAACDKCSECFMGFSAGTLAVPGLAYKLFIIRAQRSVAMVSSARTMWNRHAEWGGTERQRPFNAAPGSASVPKHLSKCQCST